ncbi:MAG: acetyl-CoA carboxylase biotin carboxyl carrier protein subunit [Opitutales bacterium]|nr:acetyl-CoA carboxylase biotin carboxyl carrier protein subunit [Opitutales bacterium]
MKKQLRITVNGKTFEVVAEVLDQGGSTATPAPASRASSRSSAPAAAAAPVASAAPAPSGGDGELLSPLAGKVVSIDKAVGSEVAEGDTVMTLEAMKMNTSVQADRAGKIEKVLVAAGDSVEEGQALLIIS